MSPTRQSAAVFDGSITDLQDRLAAHHYVADRGLAVSLYLALRLQRPLFLEGQAGVGKTALAAAVAAALETDLIRLQCYEGLDVTHAVYEWDYARQLLELRILEASGAVDRTSARRELYSDAFLIKRPLLQAIDPSQDTAGGSADRRGGSRRRRIRGLSARASRGVPDHDSRAGHRAGVANRRSSF